MLDVSDDDREISEKFMREVGVLFRVDHPCALVIKSVIRPVDGAGPRIFTECMERGSLDKVLCNDDSRVCSSLAHTAIYVTVACLAFVLRYNSLGIVHRDLKSFFTVIRTLESVTLGL